MNPKKFNYMIIGTLMIGIFMGIGFGKYFCEYENLPETNKLKTLIKRQDSIIKLKNNAIDTLRKTRTVIVIKRDGTRVGIDRNLNYIDSLSNITVSDSMVDKALLWAREQE